MKFTETGRFIKKWGSEPVHSNVRIIVTTSNIGLMRKQLDQRLFRMLGTQKLEIPPLCKQKKYIPSLMEHLVGKMSKTRHTPIKEFSMDATNKLLI